MVLVHLIQRPPRNAALSDCEESPCSDGDLFAGWVARATPRLLSRITSTLGPISRKAYRNQFQHIRYRPQIYGSDLAGSRQSCAKVPWNPFIRGESVQLLRRREKT